MEVEDVANRPVYVSLKEFPFVRRVDTEFKFHGGFSIKQKQLSINSLHEAFLRNNPDRHLLEISSKSELELGVKLSAFNLQLVQPTSGKSFSVESAFQSSKVFEHGGPFTDLLHKTSREAKRDERLGSSGAIIAFKFFNHTFPTEPKTYFYNWLYVNALARQSELAEEVMNYDAFTDIEFNPKKSLNCQAEAAAVFVGLTHAGLLDEALDEHKFLETVYQKLAAKAPCFS